MLMSTIAVSEAASCVAVLLLVVVVVTLSLLKVLKHSRSTNTMGVVCCGCCGGGASEEANSTPVYENRTLLTANKKPSKIFNAVNQVPSQDYYSPVPLEGNANTLASGYSIVKDSKSSPYEFSPYLQKTGNTNDFNYSTISYDSNGQQVYDEVVSGGGGGGGRGGPSNVYEECEPGVLQNTAYETYEHGHGDAAVDGELQHTLDSKKKKVASAEDNVYAYACVTRPDLIGADYTEPAEDENSLYAQFKALHVKLVKRDVIGIGDFLGRGQFGTVYMGEWNVQDKHTTTVHTTTVAIKTLNSNSHDADKVRFLQEAVIMGQFKHPNVITMYGLVIEKEPFMIILELLPLGDLRKHLISMRPHGGVDSDLPPILLQCCRDIALGMCYLSKIGFVHRDLAARNVLVAEGGKCKVADFGMSRDLAHENYYISHGGQIPVKWTAPEALNFRKYSTASDVWSFGVVLYEIWSLGHKPFENYRNTEIVKLIDKGIRLAPPPGCPRAVYSLMMKCWNPDSSARPSFKDAVEYLLSSDDKLLKWSVKEKAVNLSACQLGADLSVAEKLHKDLRESYT